MFAKSALIVAGMALYLSSGTSARAEEGPHRALRAARWHLMQAKEEIRDERIGRHRERVEKDIRIAIEEIDRGLREGKIEARYEPAKGWDAKYKSFKHLRQALIELDEAKADVKKEKGEWARRKELLRSIEDAHEHVQEALKEAK
jgi:hypothetical protein